MSIDAPRPPVPGERPAKPPRARMPFSANPRHFGIEAGEPWPDDVPMGQDDTHWRYEHDPKGARRAELRIAFFFSWALLGGIGLAWVFVAGGQPQVEGALWFAAFMGLAIG
ncbi:MAG: hypothetical protein J2P57_19155, partial [Acidimicrobiaceae bacterium]|nr:hypothetical protein [Acidimicrobiaceae bacterium]